MLLLIGIFCILSIYTICKAEKNVTIYVGGTGIGNFTSIQSAIDNASNGDIIYVYNGVYIENIYINKSLELIGENNPIIDGNEELYTIFIHSSHVNITGFKIENGKIGLYIGGLHNLSNINIKRNIFSDCIDGIYLQNSSSDNIIMKNIFTSNIRSICLYDSSHNNIIDNYFIDHYSYAINLMEQSRYNNISYNHINNTGGIICNRWSNGNTISKNKIINGQIKLDYCSNNKISYNEIIDSDECIVLIYSDENSISYNHINNSKIGILITNSKNNIITSNYFSKNNQDIKEKASLPDFKTPGFEIIIFIISIFFLIIIGKK